MSDFKVGNYYGIREGVIGECVTIDVDGYFWVEISNDIAKEHSLGIIRSQTPIEIERNVKVWEIELPFKKGYDYLGDNEFEKEYHKIKATELAKKMYAKNIFKEKDGYIWVSK